MTKNNIFSIALGVLALILVGLIAYSLFSNNNSVTEKEDVKTEEIVNNKTKDTKPIEVVTDKKEEKQFVKVYFNNTIFDPGLMDCSKVFPVDREIEPTLAVGRAALEELFLGPTDEETNKGYLTNLNVGTFLSTLSIEDGVAKADFTEQLQTAVGGSCRTAAIRSQITETLKQFPTVKDVIISIDGQTQNILQP